MTSHARRIYLVGALNLTSAKRKYLESINVSPIDLYSQVSDYDDPDVKHMAATKLFLQTLRDLKPLPLWEWSPAQIHRSTLSQDESNKTFQDNSYAARLLENQIEILESDRLSYPQWLACPPSLLFNLQTQINDPYPMPKNLAAMKSDKREKLLYEIAWRSEVTYETTLSQELIKEFQEICDPEKPCSLRKKQQMEVALLLLKSSRWIDEPNAALIAKSMTEILEQNVKHWPECANEVAYHQAIVARDSLDYSGIYNCIQRIDVEDSIWKLRKASLMVELGQDIQAKELVEQAHKELLLKHRKNRNSVHTLSHLAWASWLLRNIDFGSRIDELKIFSSAYQERKCNPWDSIEYLRSRISNALEKQEDKRGIEALFSPGKFIDKSSKITFSSELHPFLLLDGVTRHLGLPLRWGNVNFLVEQANKLSKLDDLDDKHRFIIAIRSANAENSAVLKNVFSRVRIASVSRESVDWLTERCIVEINYWVAKLSSGSVSEITTARDRLRVLLEVLSRVVVRSSPSQAKEIFKMGLQFGENTMFRNRWLSDAFRSLLVNSLKSIPSNQHHTILTEALMFPLVSEVSADALRWPNPIIKNPGNRNKNSVLDRRIDEIIDHVSVPSRRTSALLRLLPLFETKFLVEAEVKKIIDKLWGVTPEYKTLPETGLYPHILLALPIPDSDESAVRAMVRRYLFNSNEEILLDQVFLESLVYAANAGNNSEYPSSTQAVAYFNRLISWRPSRTAKHDVFGHDEGNQKKTGELIGNALAYSIVPALGVDSLNQENFMRLLAFYEETEASKAIIAISRFAALNDSFHDEAEKLIRKGLHAKDQNKTASSAFAILKWRDEKNTPSVERLISRLVYLLGANLGVGLPALLWTTRQMYIKNYLSEEKVESLIDSVSVIFDSTEYKNISPESKEAVSVSLVRAECVNLARDLLKNNPCNQELIRITGAANDDPLPEVRFAEADDD